jgi:uncharacterized protein (TIGR03089 family)
VVLDDGPSDLVVTDDVALVAASPGPRVLVTLAALARGAAVPPPPDVMDEARELSTYADQFSPWEEPAPSDVALRDGASTTAYETVVPQGGWADGSRVHTADGDLGQVLATALAAWAVDGSLVLSRGSGPEGGRAARLGAEGVTREV